MHTQVLADRKHSLSIGRKRLRDSVSILRPTRVFERSDVEKDVARLFRVKGSGFRRIEVRPSVIEPLQVRSKIIGPWCRLCRGCFLFYLSCPRQISEDQQHHVSSRNDNAEYHRDSALKWS